MLYEVDPESELIYYEPDDDQKNDEFQEDLLAVPQSEFEKEYEVK